MLPKFVLKKEEEKRMSGNMNKKFGMLLELEWETNNEEGNSGNNN